MCSVFTFLLLLASSALSLAAPRPRAPSVQHPPRTPFRVLVADAPAVNPSPNTPRVNVLVAEPVGAPSVTLPKENVFAALTTVEAASVVQFLHQDSSINVTAAGSAGPWDNLIASVQTVYPDKALTLDYLDGSGPVPPRYARVSVNVQAIEEPYVEHYLVGPLPISNSSTAVPYTSISSKNTSRIRMYTSDFDATSAFAMDQAQLVSDVIEDVLGAPGANFDWWGTEPLPDSNGRVTQWLEAWAVPNGPFDAQTVLPTGLTLKTDITGRDPSKWSFGGWWFNNLFYPTHEAFRSAWNSTGFVKPTRINNTDSSWYGTDQFGDKLPFDTTPPPMSVQPKGQRFAVNKEQNYVEWGPFSFFISFTRDTGLRLFDIRFGTSGDPEKKRIIYELGMDEAIAHYAGIDPVQSQTAYLDSMYGFGAMALGALPDYDCPSYATYLDATYHADEISTTHTNAICLFEADAGYLMQRHSSNTGLAATKNVAFTVRSISTIGNYDYTFEYTFTLDGSIETVVRASGYIQTAAWAATGSNNYGYNIHGGLSGSMHDHVLTFKCDLDILGTANSFLMHSLVPVQMTYPWSSESRSTMQLKKETVANEDQGKLNWPENLAGMFIVANVDKPNAFGESPGFRIKPSRGGAGHYLTVQNSSNLKESGHFTSHHLYVAQRKDNEPFASHSDNANDPGNPIVNFNDFFNSESLEQQDLVLWFNLGMSHVPHLGDLPNTVMTTAQSGVIISPHNYLTNDPSRRTRQMVRLTFAEDTGIVSDVAQFGAETLAGSLNLAALQPNLTSYVPDTLTRKFPYNPAAGDSTRIRQ